MLMESYKLKWNLQDFGLILWICYRILTIFIESFRFVWNPQDVNGILVMRIDSQGLSLIVTCHMESLDFNEIINICIHLFK